MDDMKPILMLSKCDGNAFSVMSAAKVAGRRGGMTNKEIEAMIEEMKSGDYNHLLLVALKYFDVA